MEGERRVREGECVDDYGFSVSMRKVGAGHLNF